MGYVRLGFNDLVQDTNIALNNYGGFNYLGIGTNSEIYKRSVSGSSGIYEFKSGDRFNEIHVSCEWHTYDLFALEQTLLLLRQSRFYERLTISHGIGTDMQFDGCRLSEVLMSGPPVTGVLNGTRIVIRRDLVFLQIIPS